MKYHQDGNKIAAENLPEFPLVPASKGFCISLDKATKKFRETLVQAGVKMAGVETEKFAEMVHPDDV